MEMESVRIEFLGHSGFLIECLNKKKIAIDPYNVSEKVEKVEYILITHSHYDHCSIKDIEKLSKPGTIIVVPADAQSKITRIDGVQMQVVEIGDELTLGNIKIEILPAYNVDKDFHSKSEGWFGYLIKIGKVIIYHAGDTDKIPEMNKLSGYGKHGNNFIALLPISGKYVMSAEEAVEVASIMNADLVIPMHYGSGVVGTLEDAEKFVKLCELEGLKAKVLEKI